MLLIDSQFPFQLVTKSVHFPGDDVNRKINRDSTSHIALFPGNYNYQLLMIFLQSSAYRFKIRLLILVCLRSAVFGANIRDNASYRHFIEIGEESQIWVDQFSHNLRVDCDDWPSYNDNPRSKMGHDQSAIDVHHRYIVLQPPSPSSSLSSPPSTYSYLHCISLWMISNSLPFEIVISCPFLEQ